ncbi:Similar to mxt: Eukaryotic translation initiation factor 4E-binding protein Mextli (Drosophila melanogaster) [Cotesia congregata]|uniref:Similar to mxt: Eukaryotic translation initiation factor 4E-binding protein Mextli (Drosophila melanogaster) n=1 Tax=Cotesia congregata TaxID=51543 RepID=A0A8J2HIN3_COTCN|nr:Similar to mxt: Eukaryotic translation initiation factor 4E-binding protein Mextli (Drosophila melanogaster) [Cotesia congregata]
MASTQLTPRPRMTKKHEKPRPLKLNLRHSSIDERIATVEDLVSLIDNVASNLSNGFHDPTLQQNIITMCNTLKQCAHQFEPVYKDQLDRAFVAIRNGSQDERLDLTTRIHLLELIELRAKQWRYNDSMDAYYASKLADLNEPDNMIGVDGINNQVATLNLTSPQTPPVLGVGEVIKTSGKFTKPTRIPGKNYCKDEVVIRNSDSGKGKTCSHDRGAQRDDHLLSASYAKDLIKETIQRNASPVRMGPARAADSSGIGGSSSSLNSSASDESNRLSQQFQQPSQIRSTLLHSLSTNDASIGDYKHTVNVGNHSLKITGSNLNLVRTAKIILDEHFSKWSGDSGIESFDFTDDFPSFPNTPINNQQIKIPDNNANVDVDAAVKRENSLESNATSESEETFKSNNQTIKEKINNRRNGPYAKRPPANWARIKEECPNIIRKSPIRWFEPDTYKAKVAAAGMRTVLSSAEEIDLE